MKCRVKRLHSLAFCDSVSQQLCPKDKMALKRLLVWQADSSVSHSLDRRDSSVIDEKRRQELMTVSSLTTLGDVAEAVAFLALEEAGYITGQILNVDGGMVISGL